METYKIKTSYSQLLSKITSKTGKIAILGAGYVGLTLAVQFAKNQFNVCAFDLDISKINKINEGKSYIDGISSSELSFIVDSGFLLGSNDLTTLDKYDVLIICVPTPLNKNREPEISYLLTVTKQIAKNISSTKLIILESTTFPNTTKEYILPLFEEYDLKVGENIFLAHSPERVDFGNNNHNISRIPKIVGGITESCTILAKELYEKLTEVVPVSDSTVAEMVKLYENTYRAVNIGLVNELTLLCDKMGLNVWEILDAAFTKPYGIQAFYPGPGVGGHCIPVDPSYLSWKAREYDFNFKFIELASDININMPYFIVNKLQKSLSKFGKVFGNSTILIIGVAYKKDISDYRTSPALKIIEVLEQNGANIIFHDPLVPILENAGSLYKSITLSEVDWCSVDATLIITDHTSIDYKLIVQHSKFVVDSRNATKYVENNREKIILI